MEIVRLSRTTWDESSCVIEPSQIVQAAQKAPGRKHLITKVVVQAVPFRSLAECSHSCKICVLVDTLLYLPTAKDLSVFAGPVHFLKGFVIVL